jgi:hypothetical protein
MPNSSGAPGAPEYWRVGDTTELAPDAEGGGPYDECELKMSITNINLGLTRFRLQVDADMHTSLQLHAGWGATPGQQQGSWGWRGEERVH